MRIRLALLILIIIGIILIPVILYYIGENNISQKSIYEVNWNIQIPSNIKQLYHNQDKHDFQGKGLRYTIFLIKEDSTFPLISIKKNTKNIIIEGSSGNGRDYNIEEFVHTIALELEISEKNKPIFDENYYWQKFLRYGNTLIVVYFPNINKAYFVEKLI